MLGLDDKFDSKEITNPNQYFTPDKEYLQTLDGNKNDAIIQYEEYQDNIYPKPSQPSQTFSLDFFSNSEEPEIRHEQDFSHIEEDGGRQDSEDQVSVNLITWF